MANVHDLTEQRFGRLVVLSRTYNDSFGHTYWICQCDCESKPKAISGAALRTGDTKSCGCILSDPKFSYHNKKNPMSNKKKATEFKKNFKINGVTVTVNTTILIDKSVKNDEISEILVKLLEMYNLNQEIAKKTKTAKS